MDKRLSRIYSIDNTDENDYKKTHLTIEFKEWINSYDKLSLQDCQIYLFNIYSNISEPFFLIIIIKTVFIKAHKI